MFNFVLIFKKQCITNYWLWPWRIKYACTLSCTVKYVPWSDVWTAQFINECTKLWMLRSKEAYCDWKESNYVLNKEMLIYVPLHLLASPSKIMWSLSLYLSLSLSLSMSNHLYSIILFCKIYFFKCTIYKDLFGTLLQ